MWWNRQRAVSFQAVGLARGVEASQGFPDRSYLDALCDDESQVDRLGQIWERMRKVAQRNERHGFND